MIGLLRNGDMIDIDIPNRSLQAILSEEEIAARRAAQPAWQPRPFDGWLRRYSGLVGNASKGASLKP